MSRRPILAALAASLLAVGLGACGNSEGDRQSIEKSNQQQDVPEGTPSTVETNPDALTSTGEAEPEVTQPETEP